MKKVYYIIITYNNKDLVDECLASIYNQTYKNKSIILIDNGSADGTADYVRLSHPNVTLIAERDNHGFAKANNIGIHRALSDEECGYVALINSDATLDNTWTNTLVEFADKNEGVGCLQTPTLDYYDHTILDSRGIKVDRQGRAIQLGHRQLYSEQPNHTVFGVNAAACLITADLLRSQPFNDYLDEDMWMYLEDVDFAARSTILGWKNWYVNGAFAYHMGSASSGKNPGFSIFYSYRNNLSMLVKNFPIGILVGAVWGAVWTDLQTLYRLVRGKNKVAIKAILKGRFASLRTLPLYFKKRKLVRSHSKISKQDLLRLMDAV